MHRYALLISVAVLMLSLVLCCGNALDGSVPIYTVARGEFINSVTVSGELEAVRSQIISAPSSRVSGSYPKIAQIVADGQRVEKGEQLIQFDPSSVESAITNVRNELDIALAELAKTRVSQKSAIEDLQSDLQIAEIDHKISQLNLEQAEFKAEVDRKEIELNLEKAAIGLEQARSEIDNRKMVQGVERDKLELKVKQARDKLANAEETLVNLTVVAPTPGIAILRQSWITREKYQADDQVYPGWPLIGLPDLTALKAEVEVSEIDISRIQIGQRVKVRLDAYPDTTFTGEVTEISSLARDKDRDSDVKVFDTTVIIDGTDEKMLPGMSVSCDIIIEQVPDTLFIPLESLFLQDGESIVYVKKRTGFDKKIITTGSVSDNHVIVAAGLEEGQSVALIDPTLVLEEDDDFGDAAGEDGQ